MFEHSGYPEGKLAYVLKVQENLILKNERVKPHT